MMFVFRLVVAFCIGAMTSVVSRKLTNDPIEQFFFTGMLAIIGLYFLINSEEKK
jgi:hypothetical protein